MKSNGGTSLRKFNLGITCKVAVRFTDNKRPRLPITQKARWIPQSIWTIGKSVKSLFPFSNRTSIPRYPIENTHCYGSRMLWRVPQIQSTLRADINHSDLLFAGTRSFPTFSRNLLAQNTC